MLTIAERILLLFELKNEVPTQILPQLGISKSSMSDWKRGKSTPSSDAIIKLSEHFKVSTDYLLKGSTENINGLPFEDELFLQLYKELNNLNTAEKIECLIFLKGYIRAFIDQSQKRKKS